MSSLSEVRKLRDKADKLRMKGQLQKALPIYKDLMKTDPDNPRWPHQAGEILKMQKNHGEAAAMFLKAANRYFTNGFGIQALVLAKVILDLDPDQPEALDLLKRLSENESRVDTNRFSKYAVSTGSVSDSGVGDDSSHSSTPSVTSSGPRSVELPALNEFSLDGVYVPQQVKAPVPRKPPPIPKDALGKPQSKAGPGLSTPPLQETRKQSDFAIERNLPPDAPGDRAAVEISLKSGETLDGLMLREVVGSSGEYYPVGNMGEPEGGISDPDIDDDILLGPDDDAEPGSMRGEEPRVRPVRPRLPSDVAIRRVEEAESEVSIVRAVSAFEIPLEEREVDGLLDNVFPDEEYTSASAGEDQQAINSGFSGSDQAMDSFAGTSRRKGETGDVVRALKTEAVTSTPLFGELSSVALEKLVARMSVRMESAGATIINEGEQGGELYVVVEGVLNVTKKGPPAVTVGELREGSFFGEIAIVTDLPRQASVVAKTPVKLLVISRELVVDLIQDHPEVVAVLVRFFRRRMVEIILKTSPLFAPLDNSLRRDLARRFKFLELDPNVRFIKQSRPIPGLFAIMCGSAEVNSVYNGRTNTLAQLGPGDVVGETSLLSGGKAAHSVISKTKCWMLFMPAKDLREAAVLIPEVVKYLRVLSMKRVRAAESTPDQKHEFPVERLPVY